MTTQEVDQLHDFYDLDIDIKSASIKNIKFNRLKIIRKLKDLGFYRYDTPDGSTQYVKVTENKITITKEQFIVDSFEDYILSLPTRQITLKSQDAENTVREIYLSGEKLLDKLYDKNITAFFTSIIDRLRPDKEIKILQDEANKKYLFFKNTAVYVSDDGVHPVHYDSLSGYIWDSSILDHDFIYTDDKGDFEQFCENINEGDRERKKSLMSILGYLMHDYYECNLKAILFTDVNIDDVGYSAGGTGKGILGKALQNILNKTSSDARYCCIPAKQIDISKDTRYSLADISTQLIHLEDIKHFDLEELYNDITDGATLRRPYQIRPIVKLIKMMISANHTIELKGSSKKRRVVIFELANFYNDHHTPADDFQKRFFESQWDSSDWAQFYSFMCRCAQIYLKYGLISPKEINYSIRSLIETTNEDFSYWIDSKVNINDTSHEQRIDKRQLYLDFITAYPDYSKFSQRAFSRWCITYFTAKGIPYIEMRSTSDIFVLFPSKETIKNIKRNKDKLRNKPIFEQEISI